MKKILITGAFQGAVVLMYGPEDMHGRPFMSIDMSDAVLTPRRKEILLSRVPVVLKAGFEQAWEIPELKFTTEDYEVDFTRDFWQLFGKKAHKDRAETEWKKLTKHEHVLAAFRLPAYLRYLSRTGQYKADPGNYLKKKYYVTDWDNV